MLIFEYYRDSLFEGKWADDAWRNGDCASESVLIMPIVNRGPFPMTGLQKDPSHSL